MINFDQVRLSPGEPLVTDKWNGLLDRVKELPLTISPDGNNVGIDESAPKEKLHINGAIRGNIPGGALRIQTDSGRLDIGSKNKSFVHLDTDRPVFYFNKEIIVQSGKIGSYKKEDLNLCIYGKSKLTIKTNGNIGIGYNNPRSKLEVAGGAITISNHGDGKELLFFNTERTWAFRQKGSGAQTALELASIGGGGNKHFYFSTTGRVYINGSIVQTSDVRLKHNIETLNDSLAKVTSLRGVTYKRKDGGNGDQHKQIGLIAQEVERVFPELVVPGFNRMKSLDYNGLIPILVEAIKELQAQISELQHH